MRKLYLVCLVGLACGLAARVSAQIAEKSRPLCDEKDPKNKCPGATCACSDDNLEVTFDRDGDTDSVFEYKAFVQDAPVDTTIMMDTKSGDPATPGSGVQGWSYGVDHDDAFLTLTSVTVDGTEAAKAKELGGFIVADMKGIQTCKGEPAPGCKNPVNDGGYITAIILSFTQAASLDIKRNPVCKAKYTLTKDAGAKGTLIDITDRMKKTGSPPADINITVNGISKSPKLLTDGLVVLDGVAPPPENCTNKVDDDGDGKVDCADEECVGKPECVTTPENCTNKVDDDGDGKIDCADEDCANDPVACPPTACANYAYHFGPTASAQNAALGAATSYVVSMRNLAPSLGFQLGVKSTTAANSTTWEFVGTLGTDANRLIELIITDDQGNSQTPVAGNKATSNESKVTDVARGAAIDGFKTRDFFAFDLAPGVGGTGFTVGYVADTNPPAGGGNKIAGTPAANCPVNEILKVTLGGAPPPTNFSRGDANGDKKINVTDAVLIIQIVVGILQPKVDCREALDANNDGNVNVADALPVLAYVFQKGPDLPAPFKTCGQDTGAADTLTCVASNCE